MAKGFPPYSEEHVFDRSIVNSRLVSSLLIVSILAAALAGARAERADAPPATRPAELIAKGIEQLLTMQEDDGAWPYEGVYRVDREIPVGYRVGGTSLVCQALLHATDADHARANKAIAAGIQLVLKLLDHPLMKPSKRDTYDVRVWGHGCALEFLCQLRALPTREKVILADKKLLESVHAWIPRLVAALKAEELRDGGWNYAGRKQHAPFVTAPLTQALLLARSQGEDVPDEVFARCRSALESSRTTQGGFVYSGRARKSEDGGKGQLPGAISRTPISETTLLLLGGGDVSELRRSIDAFHTHWNELEKRRKKTGTHLPPYGVAPYYFYYGHRYLAQAISMLPAAERRRERDRFLEVLLRTRDDDGTWNDRVFERSRNYGTAMAVLALLDDAMPLPPKWSPAPSAASRPTASSRPASRPGIDAAGQKP